jgi:EAL domain-containing protein (putative c-di-GMP-specific phosphodiesterase class I)/DNA-binding NarL/FixJ family response regulator
MKEPGQPLEVTAGPVLVVDDEPAVRGLFVRALRDAGYETIDAADGVEALQILEHDSVALILLDSTMPRLDGAGVIRAVRARGATRTLPVILVTAKGDLQDRIAGLEAGADDYLVKPVALDELVARVHAQLRSHLAMMQAVERQNEDRRRLAAALHRVREDGSPLVRADSFVSDVMLGLGLDHIALIGFTGNERAHLIALKSSWPERDRLGRPGSVIEPSLAFGLRKRAAEGPWMSRLRNKREVACVPLLMHDAPAALFLFGAVADKGGGRLSSRMPILLEAADMAAALLGPTWAADLGRLSSRVALEAIIAEGTFTPHFQPIVSLADRAVVGYEALTRFADGTRPDIRFAEAERLGLGLQLELATLRAAVQGATSLPSTTFLALNVSPSLVLAGGGLRSALIGTGRDLVLEITEHAQIDDYGALQAALERIDPPVKVSVDDAGSGYASLRHILALRPAFVKLDISWVRDIDADPARQALVAGLVHFATEVGCWLIGEGIATEAELRTLRGLGVAFGQGYLLGRPLPATTRVPDGAVRAAVPTGGASRRGS